MVLKIASIFLLFTPLGAVSLPTLEPPRPPERPGQVSSCTWPDRVRCTNTIERLKLLQESGKFDPSQIDCFYLKNCEADEGFPCRTSHNTSNMFVKTCKPVVLSNCFYALSDIPSEYETVRIASQNATTPAIASIQERCQYLLGDHSLARSYVEKRCNSENLEMFDEYFKNWIWIYQCEQKNA